MLSFGRITRHSYGAAGQDTRADQHSPSRRQFGRSTQWGEISEVLERLDSTHVIKADRRFLFLAGR